MRHISGAVQCGEAAQGNPGGLFLVRIYELVIVSYELVIYIELVLGF